MFLEGASTTRSVAENAPPNTAIGATVSATAADGRTLTYSLSGADASSFAIDEATGRLKTKSALDYESNSSYAVTVRADDGFEVASITVAIKVTNVNEAPEFPEGAPVLDVDENTASGTAFGNAVAATDPDGDTLRYSLSGTDAASFAIDADTGQLKTRDALDYEGANTYEVTVTASDGSLTDSVDVDISVNNLPEPPDAPGAPAVAPAALDGHSSVAVTWTAPDENGSPITDYDIEYRKWGPRRCWSSFSAAPRRRPR